MDLVDGLLDVRRFGVIRRAQGCEELCACRFEALKKVFRSGKVDAALLDSLRSCFVSEPGAHHPLHFVPINRFLLSRCRDR